MYPELGTDEVHSAKFVEGIPDDAVLPVEGEPSILDEGIEIHEHAAGDVGQRRDCIQILGSFVAPSIKNQKIWNISRLHLGLERHLTLLLADADAIVDHGDGVV